MKRVKLKVPGKMESDVVNFLIGETGVVNVVLSYLQAGDLFTPDVLVIIISFEEKYLANFEATNWKKYAVTF